MKYFSAYSPTYIEWIGDFSANIHFQDRHTAARALKNLSQELPSPPPPGLPRDDVDHPSEQTAAATSSGRPDLGAMGWRLGNTLIRKIANDRFGRQGTTARVLMRTATSLDFLQERPSSWMKVPGFSTKRVLGPTAMSTGIANNNHKEDHSSRDKKLSSGGAVVDNGRKNKKRKSKKRGRAESPSAARTNKVSSNDAYKI